ncbi:nascent polypeptide-associated complex subunit alpha, muscle-specific form-like isoform X1 [Canis lupus familiaris]|uniref:nascent polypeptide-associated complex subunit alpha, muscle-specific form-like isoform X1 n=1 Tax=Canis lupus familiaris TaxID=9615 RepID=UPI0018F7D757|nr:nascent polypeptide-associated complex subunit alpha, muscle-specific form-like isoform X1 [Canis lupus familiaris]
MWTLPLYNVMLGRARALVSPLAPRSKLPLLLAWGTRGPGAALAGTLGVTSPAPTWARDRHRKVSVHDRHVRGASGGPCQPCVSQNRKLRPGAPHPAGPLRPPHLSPEPHKHRRGGSPRPQASWAPSTHRRTPWPTGAPPAPAASPLGALLVSGAPFPPPPRADSCFTLQSLGEQSIWGWTQPGPDSSEWKPAEGTATSQRPGESGPIPQAVGSAPASAEPSVQWAPRSGPALGPRRSPWEGGGSCGPLDGGERQAAPRRGPVPRRVPSPPLHLMMRAFPSRLFHPLPAGARGSGSRLRASCLSHRSLPGLR